MPNVMDFQSDIKKYAKGMCFKWNIDDWEDIYQITIMTLLHKKDINKTYALLRCKGEMLNHIRSRVRKPLNFGLYIEVPIEDNQEAKLDLAFILEYISKHKNSSILMDALVHELDGKEIAEKYNRTHQDVRNIIWKGRKDLDSVYN